MIQAHLLLLYVPEASPDDPVIGVVAVAVAGRRLAAVGRIARGRLVLPRADILDITLCNE